jgi:hypothetical protein
MHESFGTKVTKERLDLLNYGKTNQIGVLIEDLYDAEEPKGTKVTVSMPLIKQFVQQFNNLENKKTAYNHAGSNL